VLLASLLQAADLRVYAIDTEGGKATLYVAPSGESLLVDTGYGGFGGRDPDRIMAAVKAAGLTKIDNLLTTHFHQDHMGGLRELAAKIPIGTFYDHGKSVEGDTKKLHDIYAAYVAESKKHKRVVIKPGDTIPVKGLRIDVVAANGVQLSKPLAGGGQPNPTCTSYKPIEPDPGENAHSAAVVITFGKFRLSDLGDLYWNQEHDLACPASVVGPVDVYMTTHHGTKTSGSPQMLAALHPRVAIMNNGPTKGGSVEAWTTIHESPGLRDLWQLHFSEAGGKEHNVPDQFLANTGRDCQGNRIELTVHEDGTFTVRNTRNGFEKSY
jgi:competence protein ComEC